MEKSCVVIPSVNVINDPSLSFLRREDIGSLQYDALSTIYETNYAKWPLLFSLT